MANGQLTSAEFKPSEHGGRVIVQVDVTAMLPRLQRFNKLLNTADLTHTEGVEFSELSEELGNDLLVGVLTHAEHVGAIRK